MTRPRPPRGSPDPFQTSPRVLRPVADPSTVPRPVPYLPQISMTSLRTPGGSHDPSRTSPRVP